MDENQSLQNLEKLLKTWSTNICETTKEIIIGALGRYPETMTNYSQDIMEDIRDRQSRVISAIQEAHNRQLELLKSAISEERKEFARAQLVFEQSLRTKYEHSIEALRETIQSELDSRMARTLKSLESHAKLEAQRAKQAHDFEYEVENRLNLRLRSIISDLRKSWEEEEVARIKQAEEKIRTNYSIVLEHMESQLHMALQLQDDADRKWFDELEDRNKKQLETIRMFENKCKKLYETRLIEYAEKTCAQIASYEEKLLEVSSALAAEKNQFESRLRRIKLACSRWKVAYQNEIHQRYREMTNALDDRYANEISTLLTEVNDLKMELSETQRNVERKEKEILKIHETYSSSSSKLIPLPQIRNELSSKFDELKTSSAERIDILTGLLDTAQTTPELLALYDSISTKLAARVPIVQLQNRKQFLEYKLKLASRVTQEGASSMTSAEKADLISELTEVKTNLERSIKQYEHSFGEAFHSAASETTVGSTSIWNNNNSSLRKPLAT